MARRRSALRDSGGLSPAVVMGASAAAWSDSTIPYLKPETLLAVRREVRHTVHLGANWCETLQMVAGAGGSLLSEPFSEPTA